MLIKELKFMPKSVTDDFKARLNLSQEESDVYDLAINDKTITEISIILRLSTATVSRRLQSIRYKIKVLRLFNSNKGLSL